MAEPGCGAQFRAAVRVIQGLPRSGSYRPSYEEMLRFYSYYKQATAGRCQGPRPGFWDPIGRYKWDAWHSLGRMSKEEAMAAYVAEMKKVAQKVIDTVPMDEATREMFKYFEPLYEVIRDMPRPPEDFFKGEGGEWEPRCPPAAPHAPRSRAVLLTPAPPCCCCPGTALASRLCSPRGGRGDTPRPAWLPSSRAGAAEVLVWAPLSSRCLLSLGSLCPKLLGRKLELWLPNTPRPYAAKGRARGSVQVQHPGRGALLSPGQPGHGHASRQGGLPSRARVIR